MFKRRLAVLGAVCALALTGLAGSALADEPTSTAGAKVTCTTSDGKTIEFPEINPGEQMGVLVGPDGKVKKVDPKETVKLEALPLPEGAKGEPHVKIKKFEEGDAVPALPATPGEPVDVKDVNGGVVVAEKGEAPVGEPGKAVKITCKKAE
ncbi:hypothetical protein [Nonomuraea basaltis]|uniref:hypothetical protein n=1 Tax=Nonomuraea basaltis TaxID=2495887 RepID=UPI00110C5259|nr:hypothetical protein [Nonomuraea basaltis]TMR99395.1 hypothetical protein EJK15_07535 [Nonomuraea basaltis]